MASKNTKTYRTETTDTGIYNSPAPWEPRVARVEVGLDSLKDTVSNLVEVVRTQGAQTERQIQELVVAVTQAKGPRQTDWPVIISAVFLVMAIGSAVFWPLNQTSSNNKAQIEQLITKIDQHSALDSHPVSAVLIQRVEERLATQSKSTSDLMKNHDEMDAKEFQNLDKKLQTEYTLMNSRLETQIRALDDKVQLEMRLLGETVNSRIAQLEHITDRQDTMDLQELRAWRNKASGLSSPGMAVPLIPKEIKPKAVEKPQPAIQ
jgi:hypothetical protein